LLISRGHRVEALARESDTDELLALSLSRVIASPVDLPQKEYDAIVDTAGIAESVDSVRDDGAFISIDDNEQPAPQRGITPAKSYVDEDGSGLESFAELVSTGSVTVPVARTFRFDEAPQAHALLAAGGTRGKVLLIP
ncbi:MAG: zinc-binding dehydrogenase, partial [Rhodococcus sp. (in: high G+C Gram-positive bacteria)]